MTQIAALKTMHPAHPIGVYFETENIYTLNPSSQYSLDIQALLADWESGNKSRRMILSYDQRIMTGQYPVADLMGYRHTAKKRMALIMCPEEDSASVEWARQKNGVWVNKSISSLEFLEKMFRMMNWNRECRYKVLGRVANSDQGLVMLFDLEEAIMFTPQPQEFTDPMTGEVKKKQVKFFPDIYKGRIGRSYNDYVATHQMSMFENIVSYQGDEQAQAAIMAAKNEEVEGKKEAEDVKPTASAATETERIDHEINSSGPSSTQTINTEEGQNQYLYEKRGATT